MDNLQILIEALLSLKDIAKSKQQIMSELPKLESQLQSDKKARVNITAGIDINKSKNLIQAQLNTLANQAKAPTIKVGIDTSSIKSTQEIANELKSTNKQIQQTSNSLTNLADKFKEPIKPTFDNEGLINAEKTISKVQQHFQELGNVSVKGVYSDKEAVDSLDKMVVSIKNGQKEARTLTFELDKAGKAFYLTSGTSDNSGVDKFIESVQKAIESVQKAKDKLKAIRIDLASTLKSIGTGYSDPNSVKPIVDDTHIKNLNNQYVHALRSIAELKNADNTTMASMKANAEKEIDTLKRMVKEYQNAEYAATSLRTKDISTVKESQTNDLNKFIAQINSAKIPIQAITSDIETLKTSLVNVTDKESLTAYLNQFDVVKTKFDSIKVTYNSIADAIKQLTALQNNTVFTKNASNPQVIQTKQEITQLLAEYQKLMIQMQGDITPEGLKSIGNQLTQLNARFNTATTTAKQFEAELKTDNGAEKFKQKVSILTAQIKEFQKVNSKSLKKYGTDFNRMLEELTNPNLDVQGLERIRVEFQNIKREINTAGLAGKDFFGRIKEQAAKFASWMSLTGVITGAWHEVKKMVTNVVELDNCLLELSKVSDLSATGLKSITKEAYEMGKQVGKTGTDVINAVTNFKRAGFDLKESMSFAKDALVLTNVAEGITDTGEAATALISIMKGYGDTSLEFSQKILDATNEVSNTQAINFDDLIDGSQRLSAVAKQAGVSYEQMLGILTGTNEVLQNIEKTASGQITIFTRLQGIQLPDEEDVMPIAKLQETINTATKGAVNIVDQTSGELRNVYDILNDINNVWDTLDKNTQEGIAFAAAGTRQKNVFLSMMENWKNVESATKSAQNSLGSAAIENQKYLDSISGKLANLESKFQSLSQTVVNSDLIKTVVDFGTGVIGGLDEIIKFLGEIPSLLLAISAVGLFKNVGSPKMFGLVLICQQ